jgi:hypothetical protein
MMWVFNLESLASNLNIFAHPLLLINLKYRKSFMFTLKRLVDIDFDEELNEFRNKSVINLYGSIFAQLKEHIIDVALEETFLIDDEESDEDVEAMEKAQTQAKSMSLLRYMFKTVSLTSLFKMGFKHRHLQFIIINFIGSPVLPKV